MCSSDLILAGSSRVGGASYPASSDSRLAAAGAGSFVPVTRRHDYGKTSTLAMDATAPVILPESTPGWARAAGVFVVGMIAGVVLWKAVTK